jgi:hypothetical protein
VCVFGSWLPGKIDMEGLGKRKRGGPMSEADLAGARLSLQLSGGMTADVASGCSGGGGYR